MEGKVKTVRQVFTLPDIALLAAIAALGVAIILFGKDWSGAGYLVLLCLLSMVPFWRHGFRINGQRGEFKEEEILVARECKDSILSFLDDYNHLPTGLPAQTLVTLEGESDSLEHRPRQEGGALVEVFTGKGGKIFARYFDYADFAKGKEYELHEISPEKKERLKEIDAQSKKK